MIDINATDFIQKFDVKEGTVGVIGYGYVGQAVEHFFKKACKTLVYDKAKPELGTLESVVRNSEIIFVAVPTPMRTDGSCFTGIVESVILDIKEEAKRIERNTNSFIVIVKSTVRPGFTEEIQGKYLNMRILFSPEFLTEKSSIKDFQTTNRIIVGGDEDDALVVFKFFEGVMPERIASNRLSLLHCDNPTVAEMVKLFTNGILMTKVMFANEVYLMCQKLGIDYNEVRMLSVLDPRIGASHTLVPGPDGKLGAGGHCFPKDINNLRYTAWEMGIAEKIFSAVISRNDEVRKDEDKDWLQMQGRAVIDE